MSEQRSGIRKHIALYLISIYLLIGLLVLTQPVNAEPSPSPVSVDTLQQMRQTIDQQRSHLLKERDRVSDIEQAAKNQLDGIELNIQATDSAYQNYDVQIQQANQRLREVQEDLAQAEERYYQKQAATIARLRFLQRQQRTGFGWDILLKSQNINEF
ncbi:MAG TPA: peptidase M23, partial [Allocoleopsis sp.]